MLVLTFRKSLRTSTTHSPSSPHLCLPAPTDRLFCHWRDKGSLGLRGRAGCPSYSRPPDFPAAEMPQAAENKGGVASPVEEVICMLLGASREPVTHHCSLPDFQQNSTQSCFFHCFGLSLITEDGF